MHLTERMGPREGRTGGLPPPSSHWQPCVVARESEPSILLLTFEHRRAAGRKWRHICKFSDSVCVVCYSAVHPWFPNILVSVTSRIVIYCGLVFCVTLQIWILYGLPFWMPPNGKLSQRNACNSYRVVDFMA